jgi:ADP-ribose pyrophosphatase YjhB (NUDIX family)
MKEIKSQYPNTFYRVSVKAVIRNEKNEVLVVKEQGSEWSLPGGGIDHGESIEEALKRELYEEVLVDEAFSLKPLGVDFIYLHTKQAWFMWVVYEINFDEIPVFGIGVDADEVAFIDPLVLKDSKIRTHQLLYRWTVDRSHHVDLF